MYVNHMLFLGNYTRHGSEKVSNLNVSNFEGKFASWDDDVGPIDCHFRTP